MPKLEWHDDNATLAKIKTQVMHGELIILVMPTSFDFSLDLAACDCREESGLLTYCQPTITLTILAKQNDVLALQDIANAADNAGLTVDIDAGEGHLGFRQPRPRWYEWFAPSPACCWAGIKRERRRQRLLVAIPGGTNFPTDRWTPPYQDHPWLPSYPSQ